MVALQERFAELLFLTDPHGVFYCDEHELQDWTDMHAKVAGKLAAGNFNPKVYETPRGCKVGTIVPIHRTGIRHIPIAPVTFHTLLRHSGFLGVPNHANFVGNREVIYQWTRSVFDFTRLGIEPGAGCRITI